MPRMSLSEMGSQSERSDEHGDTGLVAVELKLWSVQSMVVDVEHE